MGFPIDYNFHTHTFRCGHAKGEDEEYIKAAIKSGIKVLGFTDHVPFPGFTQERIRMNYESLEEYLSTMRMLQKKYEKKIKIYVGLECEYIAKYDSYLRGLKQSGKVDYLILGNHGFLDENNDWYWYNEFYHSEEILRKYEESSIAGLKSGLFSIFAHPDLFINRYTFFDELASEVSENLLKTAAECGVHVEINCGGLSKVMHVPHGYPNDEFWKIAKGVDNLKVLIGLDAHRPEELINDERVNYCLDVAKRFDIKLDSNVFKK